MSSSKLLYYLMPLVSASVKVGFGGVYAIAVYSSSYCLPSKQSTLAFFPLRLLQSNYVNLTTIIISWLCVIFRVGHIELAG